ncbi:hypothetical protein BDY21DRAFT_66848 [Lineolata rhizophorae]|uniref:AAA+ ATPase domain-containing protein n=1 Tax=Lineolata rhizophorae TaxID=578093 RepID=A0A6A6NUV6_9PEZI|nr:hypothetical protein BDY21DRAFT_66848 [Lineolata rhizophorae]
MPGTKDADKMIEERIDETKKKQEGKKDGEKTNSQRLLRVDQIYSRKDRQTHFVKTAKSLNKAKQNRFNKTTLVVRRIITSKGMVGGIEVDIKSPGLKEVMANIYEGVEGLHLNKTPPMANPNHFFHALPGLAERRAEEAAKPTPDTTLLADLDIAIEYTLEDFGSDMANLRSLSEHGEITYDLVWALFPPNAIVYTAANQLHQPHALRFLKGEYVGGEEPHYALECRMISHDGQDFGWATMDLKIRPFEGARKVYGLDAFPLESHPEAERVREMLIERGKTYVSLLKPTLKDHRGLAMKWEWTQSGDRIYKFYAPGRVMLDPVAYRQQNASSSLLRPWVPGTIPASSLSPDDLLLCAYWHLGYSFSKKGWGAFPIAQLSDVTWNDEAFARLVMEPGRRSLIHSLVKSHYKGPGEDADSDVTAEGGDVEDGSRGGGTGGFDDVVVGKGRGLVGLLSGNPGVGKTLTAEAVAEITRRPLLTVTAGELGVDAVRVDRTLESTLDIARRWNCVLLIDEADVFLQIRDMMNLQRNALVSIFLRRIEYFQGVLIMTTNRKQAIDAAFQSRIHFQVHYPDLDETSRAAVWTNFLSAPQPLPSTASHTSSAAPATAAFSPGDIAELAKIPLNGRQIKNAVACAMSIAREEKAPLTVPKIRQILDIVTDYAQQED